MFPIILHLHISVFLAYSIIFCEVGGYIITLLMRIMLNIIMSFFLDGSVHVY
jgi:hypothetical protein